MVINKRAIEEFLERPLANSERAKQFTSEALDAKLAELNPRPEFIVSPWINQKVCFLLGLKYQGYLFLKDMGLGKTWVILNLFKYRLATSRKFIRMLVLVPNVANVQQWVDECVKQSPSLTVDGVSVAGSENRMALINGQAEVVIITYAGFLSLVCKDKPVVDKLGEPVLNAKGEVETKGWTLDEKKFKPFTKLFHTVVMDETSVLLRNQKSLMWRTVKKLCRAVECKYGLTGTPFGKNPEDLWSQFNLIDDGETLGETLGLFRGAFFKEKANYFSPWPDYVFDKSKETQLYDMIRHRSVRYKKEECLDLPPKIQIPVRVTFTEETWAYYEGLVKELKEARGNFTLMESAYLRMRQLTSGYLAVKDPEGEKITVRFKSNPKMEAMVEKLDEVVGTSKVIIFHDYITTGQIICEALKANKVKHTWLYSGTKDKVTAVKQFQQDEKTRVIVSSKSGAFGGNWQVANYVFFYETPTSPDVRQQEEDRSHRGGQTQTVFCYDFIVRASIDEKIQKSLHEGIDFFESLIDGKVGID